MPNLKDQLIQEAKEVYLQLEANKELYQRMDDIIAELIELNFQGGDGVSLVDNFKSKNISWKVTGVRRFELKFDKSLKG